MNIPRPEHLDAQYIYRDYGGYIFKLPRNKDLFYQSVETQEFYYWTLAKLAYTQIISETQRAVRSNKAQVAGWELTSDSTNTDQPTSRYIQLTELKKQQRDKLIAFALASIYEPIQVTSNSSNPFQYIETIS